MAYDIGMGDTALITELFKAVGTSKAELVREVERLKAEVEKARVENIRLRQQAREGMREEHWR